MKKEAQILALAELDGCKIDLQNSSGTNIIITNGDIVTIWNDGTIEGDVNHYCEKLITFRDAIIPLVEKVMANIDQTWAPFWEQVRKMFGIIGVISPTLVMLMTASQIAEALLRSVGKWIEEEGE